MQSNASITGLYLDTTGRKVNIFFQEDEGLYIMKTGGVNIKYKDSRTLLRDIKKIQLVRKGSR